MEESVTFIQHLIKYFGGAIKLAGNFTETGHYEVHGGDEKGLAHAHEELWKVVPEVNVTHLAYTILSAFTVFFGMFSALVKERLFFGEPIIATGLGIVFSDIGADIFSPRNWNGGKHFNEMTLEIMRVVIALSVFAVGVELPKSYVLKHWRSLIILLGPNMLLGWVISGGLIYAIIPKLTFLQSLVVAAAVTPTDPVLAASVVGRGKFAQEHVPSHLRHLLQCESGSNDGAAFPFLFLALFILLKEDESVGDTIGHWILLVLLYQIILGTFIGVLIGIAARKLMKFSKRRGLIDRESMVAMYVALALFTTGVTTLAGSDDLLAAFACGTAFAWDDWFSESIEDSNFANIIDLLVNCATFVYIGATMPFSSWGDSQLSLTPWRLVVLAICVLILRRLPVILAFYTIMPDIKTFREAIFCGHFGPMGVGAIFIATLATERLPTPVYPPETSLDVLALTVQPIVYFLVLSSILVHGITIPFFSVGKRLGNRVTSISRTFTAASGGPAWLSHTRKVDRPDDVVINRDADLEKGNATPSDAEEGVEEGDSEKPSIQDSPPDESPKDEKRISTDQVHPVISEKKTLERVIKPKERRGSNSSDMAKRKGNNLLRPFMIKRTSTSDIERDPIAAARDRAARKERVDCTSKNERTWIDGNTLIIERNNGEEVEVRSLDPKKPSAAEGTYTVTDSARADGNMDDNTFEGLVRKYLKRATDIAKPKLTVAGEDKRQKSPKVSLEEKRNRESADLADKDIAKDRTDFPKGETSYIEGHKLVIERDDGEDVEVRALTSEEREKLKGRGPGGIREFLENIEDAVDKRTGKEAEASTSKLPTNRPHSPAEALHSSSRPEDKELAKDHTGIDKGEVVYKEGDKLVIERNDGEDVEIQQSSESSISAPLARSPSQSEEPRFSLKALNIFRKSSVNEDEASKPALRFAPPDTLETTSSHQGRTISRRVGDNRLPRTDSQGVTFQLPDKPT